MFTLKFTTTILPILALCIFTFFDECDSAPAPQTACYYPCYSTFCYYPCDEQASTSQPAPDHPQTVPGPKPVEEVVNNISKDLKEPIINALNRIEAQLKNVVSNTADTAKEATLKNVQIEIAEIKQDVKAIVQSPMFADGPEDGLGGEFGVGPNNGQNPDLQSQTAVNTPNQQSQTAVNTPNQQSQTAVNTPNQQSQTAVNTPNQQSQTAVNTPNQQSQTAVIAPAQE